MFIRIRFLWRTTIRNTICSAKSTSPVAEFDGQQVLKVEPQALTLLAQQAFHDAAFMLRVSHQQQVASILLDPEASDNDKYVALQFLRNSEIAAKGVLPTCQDTGTAIIMGKKGQRVWTGGGDEAALAQGVYNTYTEDNLRYSQNAPLDMYKEVNTGTNLPAQIDLYSVDGEEYKFLCMAKGGGSANKTYLYQETKALITPAKLKNYLVEKMRTLGTAACPPYHIAFCDRRHLSGSDAEDRQTGLDPLLRRSCRPKVTNTVRRSATCSWSRSCCRKRRTSASARSSAGNTSPTISG
ncbi:fumarate hydratase FumB [Klebsiella pneumoniae subsp. pneumoniae]|nr:fumarate hydratase FumB [Klebsiella pneumoniae subsp. pneumoniae]